MTDNAPAILGPLEIQEQPGPSRSEGIKVRLTLGPALIDLEATLEEIVVVVTRLTQEFTKAAIIPTGTNTSSPRTYSGGVATSQPEGVA